MTEFFREAMGSASVQQNTKDIKGSRPKKSSKAKVTKNGRSLTAGSSKTTGKTRDLSDGISSTPNHRRKRDGDNAEEATPETRTVPQPSSGINPEAQPDPQPSLREITTSTPAYNALTSSQVQVEMGSSHDNNTMMTMAPIKPYQQVGDRLGVHEPMYVLSFIGRVSGLIRLTIVFMNRHLKILSNSWSSSPASMRTVSPSPSLMVF